MEAKTDSEQRYIEVKYCMSNEHIASLQRKRYFVTYITFNFVILTGSSLTSNLTAEL